jgi:hypothetical protein
MRLVEEKTNRGVLFFYEHLQGQKNDSILQMMV